MFLRPWRGVVFTFTFVFLALWCIVCQTWTFSGPWEEAKWSCYKRRYIWAHLPHNLLSMHYIVMHLCLQAMMDNYLFCCSSMDFAANMCLFTAVGVKDHRLRWNFRKTGKISKKLKTISQNNLNSFAIAHNFPLVPLSSFASITYMSSGGTNTLKKSIFLQKRTETEKLGNSSCVETEPARNRKVV